MIDDLFRDALGKVRYPGFDLDILAMDLVETARLEGGVAKVKLRTVQAPPQVREELENAVAAAVMELPGVTSLELDFPEPPKPQPAKEGPHPVEGVSAIVPVASGQGGVGKSTVAVNLAMGLLEQGLKVGLLDLDLYGPSIPLMLGLRGAEPQGEGNKLLPIQAHGLKVMSIGFMIPPEKALIWRGPLIMKAVRQLLHEVAWAPLDVLILDLPPGTGDVQISMTQEVPIAGAVVVTTPQDVALIDAVKGVDMFQQTKAPVLGIVENMSYFICPDCDARHEIFGHGSVEPLCKRLGVDFLGELPLDAKVRQQADAGQPAVNGGTPAAEAYRELARKVKNKLTKIGAIKESR
ncbi:MAG: Mrp/NBP35 family ATP-binding protein [Pseudomonadota bacterium]